MTAPTQGSITILGGGASGVLLVAHLLRDRAADVHVTLVDPHARLGRGLAYSASLDCHVLNVPAGNMSAFADEPDHFWRWLEARNLVSGDDRFVFLPRRLYGDYLGDVLAGLADDRLTVRRSTAVDIEHGRVRLENGELLPSAGATVLATGHESRPPFAAPDDREAPVLILGSGLSSVDAWLDLEAAGHRGPVSIASRHGLLPLRHQNVPKATLDDVPLGRSAREVMRWFRDAVRQHDNDWRGVADGLRPYIQRIWQAWSPASRRAFLTHIRPYWNIHRHRLPAAIDDRLRAAIAQGRVTLHATRRDGEPDAARFARIYDCRGLLLDLERSSNPLLAALRDRGDIRPDPLHIGVDVTADCAVIARDGTPSPQLYAIGPLTRGALFEIEAIPEIRIQAATLAARLVDDQAGRRPSSFSTPSIRPFM